MANKQIKIIRNSLSYVILLLGLHSVVVAQTINITYHNNHIYLPCQVNGKAANLVFDTGAELIYLDSTYIATSGLTFNQVGQAKIGGAGLETKKTKIIFGEVAVTTGGNKYTPQYVPLVNLRPILGDRADGIFGLKEIADKVISIDIKAGKMTLADSLTSAMTDGYTRIPIEYVSERVLIPFTVTIGEGQTISGKGLMDLGSGQGIHFTSKAAAEHHLERIEGKTPFHDEYGGIGGESSGYEFAATSAMLGGLEITPGIVRYSTDATGALARDTYTAIIGNKIWQQFSIIIDLKGKSLYLKLSE